MENLLSAVANIRPAAVAGAFYPGDPRALLAEVDELLETLESFAPRFGHPKALIVPHAGYIYSGPVAGSATPGRLVLKPPAPPPCEELAM